MGTGQAGMGLCRQSIVRGMTILIGLAPHSPLPGGPDARSLTREQAKI